MSTLSDLKKKEVEAAKTKPAEKKESTEKKE